MIHTAKGPISLSQLGHCQMHEHLFVHATPASEETPNLRIDDEMRSAAELADYRAAGGCTILDAQPIGAGRDAGALMRMSRQSGVNIIAVTGYHLLKFYQPDHWIHYESMESLRERFLRELMEGMEEAETVRAGAVKAAIFDEGPVGRFEIMLRAAAGAAARADVPLILHTQKGAGAVEAIKISETEGLAPHRIAVCHVDRQASDYTVHEAIARTGVFMEYDTIARYKYHDDAAEIRLIQHMLEKDHGDRLLFSLDTTADRLKHYEGSIGLDFILKEFIPRMHAAGINKGEIENITVNNPKRIFE